MDFPQDYIGQIIQGDALSVLRTMPDESVQMVCTSPPYWSLRDYGVPGQLGLEKTPEIYTAKMVEIFREVRRVLRKDGTLWLNLGDSYAGSGKGAWDNKNGGQKEVYIPDSNSPQTMLPKVPDGLKPKDLVGIPWRIAFALQADGWYLRCDIIWSKPNPMPESVTDRPTKAHEYLFLMSKSGRYYYDAEAVKEKSTREWRDETVGPEYMPRECGRNDGGKRKGNGKPDKQRGHSRRHAGFNDRWDLMSHTEQCSMGRNKRDVWTIATQPFLEAHFATFPEDLVRPCILAGSREGDTILDPFMGSGTVAVVCEKANRQWLGIELNPAYIAIANNRLMPFREQVRLV